MLDSGSDGDLLFVHEGSKVVIPYKERYAPQKWRTSNGTFKTTNVGILDLNFPEFSKSKRATFKPDIVKVAKSEPKPAYDLIIGVKSLANMGAILDFANKELTIDHVTLPMRPPNLAMDPEELQARFQRPIEPKSTREATERVVRILDAKYEKANILEVIRENCKHLTVRQQVMLVSLLTEFETLFDGTLGDWKTKPVGFKLKEGTKPYHGWSYPVPHIHKEMLKKEVERLYAVLMFYKNNQNPNGPLKASQYQKKESNSIFYFWF